MDENVQGLLPLIKVENKFNKFLVNLQEKSKDAEIFENYHKKSGLIFEKENEENKEYQTNFEQNDSCDIVLNKDTKDIDNILSQFQECIIGNLFYQINDEEIMPLSITGLNIELCSNPHKEEYNLYSLCKMIAIYLTNIMSDTNKGAEICTKFINSKLLFDTMLWILQIFLPQTFVSEEKYKRDKDDLQDHPQNKPLLLCYFHSYDTVLLNHLNCASLLNTSLISKENASNANGDNMDSTIAKETQYFRKKISLNSTVRLTSSNTLINADICDGNFACVCESVTAVLTIALNFHYPQWKKLGYGAFLQTQPVIYMSDLPVNYSITKYLVAKLKLSPDNFTFIPCQETIDDGEIMPTTIYDIHALKYTIKNDITYQQNKLPVFLIAYASTPQFGENDDLAQIYEICKSHDIWLHVEGDNLAYLPSYSQTQRLVYATNTSNQKKMVTSEYTNGISALTLDESKGIFFNSLNLPLNQWLHLPHMPCATLIHPLGEDVVSVRSSEVFDSTILFDPDHPSPFAYVTNNDENYEQAIEATVTSVSFHKNKSYDGNAAIARDTNTALYTPTTNRNKFLSTDEALQHHSYFHDDINPYRCKNHNMRLDDVIYQWVILQALGINTIVNKITETRDLGAYLIRLLRNISEIKILGYEQENANAGEKGNEKSSLTASIRTLNTVSTIPGDQNTPGDQQNEQHQKDSDSNPHIKKLMEYLSQNKASVVFRYVFEAEKDNIFAPIDESNGIFRAEKINGEYFNALNIWLAQIMNREFAIFDLKLIQKEGSTKVYIECNFFKSFPGSACDNSQIEVFVEKLRAKIEIMNATHYKRHHELGKAVAKYPNLKLVDLTYWAGLGAVHYIPEIWIGKSDNLPRLMAHQLNLLNETLVKELNSKDSAFAIGKMETGLSCVGFGMITKETNIEELIKLVNNTGLKIEKSMKLHERISEIIAGSIKAVTHNLEKENEEKFYKEGVLRHMPLVGPFMNWWSPTPPHSVKGKSFDFDSGKIEDSEKKAYISPRIINFGEHSSLQQAPYVVQQLTHSNVFDKSSVKLTEKPQNNSKMLSTDIDKSPTQSTNSNLAS